MFIKVFISNLEVLKPKVEHFYDEDIGFSENSYTVSIDGQELTFLEPSSLGYGAISFYNEKERTDITKALKSQNIEYDISETYC